MIIRIVFFVFIIANLILIASCDRKENREKKTFPPCKACKMFAESFEKSFKKTSKGKFEGGDADWEEKKMGAYATSEIRLIEIQEDLCSDLVDGKDQCFSILEQHEADIEKWWFHMQDKVNFFQYFCIDTVKQCCPELHFGALCTPCDGYPDNVCSGNGRCKGEGTRKGNGKCACEEGYALPTCADCESGYYEAYRDERKLLCAKCHVACEGPCTREGPSGCLKCQEGWLNDTVKGCLDINECTAKQSPCTTQQFCVNNDGSFKCLDCDKSCTGCTGDGPDMCHACAEGYIYVENMCIDAKEESRKNYVSFTRYLTYLGLCIATCIILNKNTTLAGIVGIAVAVYIALSEYIMNSPKTPSGGGNLAQQILGR